MLIQKKKKSCPAKDKSTFKSHEPLGRIQDANVVQQDVLLSAPAALPDGTGERTPDHHYSVHPSPHPA